MAVGHSTFVAMALCDVTIMAARTKAGGGGGGGRYQSIAIGVGTITLCSVTSGMRGVSLLTLPPTEITAYVCRYIE